MERMTRIIPAGALAGTAVCDLDANEDVPQSVVQKLSDYEDAEEQGRMIILPCKTGQTVYAKSYIENGIAEFEYKTLQHIFDDYVNGIFGETVFLTREEAETALSASKAGEAR